MAHALFAEIVLILGLSALALFACHRMRLPTIVGFLLVGGLSGPYGLSLVSAVTEVEALAEIGITLLLFTIGIEFNIEALARLRRVVLLGGMIQVVATMSVTTGILIAAGTTLQLAVLGGMLTSLSSTAIVLKITQQRGELDTVHGRFTVGVLIFQDLVIVPMLLAVPFIAGHTSLDPRVLAPLVLRGVALLALILVVAKWVLPRFLRQVASTRDPELFQVSLVALGFGIAFLTYRAGLSLGMGAFLAGLTLSASPFAHRALGNLLPLRDLFMSFFFVSVGMLFDVRVLFLNPVIVFGGATLLITLKGLIVALAGLVSGVPLRAAVLAGVALAQVGEFSFLLAQSGLLHGLLGNQQFQLFLGASALSMVGTPFLMGAAPRLAELTMRLPLPKRLRLGSLAVDERPSLQNHLVIIGYGLIGRHLAEAADRSAIKHVVIEANPDTVHTERALGRSIFHGDATQAAVLEHVRVGDARVAVVAVSDTMGTRRIVDRLRSLSPMLHIIARTHYVTETEPLRALGADDVIPEEYEASIEIFTRVLHKYLVPKEQITAFADGVRSGGYAMLREPSGTPRTLADLDLFLCDMEVRVACVEASAGAIGHSLADVDLRRAYGIMVLAVRRSGTTIQLPDGDERFSEGDEVVLLGLPELLPFAVNLFRARDGRE